MNSVTAMITVTLVVVIALGNIISANLVLASSNEVNDPFNTLGSIFSFSKTSQDSSTQNLQNLVNSLLAQQLSNPLLDKEEFDITVTNIKQKDILVALTVDGLKNSTVIPGSPVLPNPTPTKVVVFKFDRHEGAGTPGVLPIKLGDQYTACISFTTNTDKATCLSAGIDSITQPQKKTLDANYIPT